ncbi:MAG: ABC-F family ATP-binding cassette domain-containing protein [Firmicutes bacterium]|nr:ABC-F family ATP-binding cassette domain-containing protein [Bacillota bacterium]
MLQIQNLTLIHQKDLRTIVQDFSFSLQSGDRAVIIGEEGNGKSTLLKWIYDPAMVEDYVSGEDGCAAARAGHRIADGLLLGYLPQELTTAEKTLTVYEFYCRSMSFFDQTPRELAAIAAQLGLPGDFYYYDQPIHLLSGGEKIKMQMARILMENPDVLLLDEPSNDIDIETLEWLERFINQTAQPVLFVSHDELLIERTANVVIHLEKLERGRSVRHTIVRQPYREYIQQRQDNIDRKTALAANEEREYRKQMERFYHIQQQVEHRQATVSRQSPSEGRLLKKKMKAVKSQERRFEREQENRTEVPHTELAIMVSFDESISLPPGKRVLDYQLDHLTVEDRTLANDLSLRVMGGEKVCIVGHNGCGKSTLMKLLAAALLPRTDLKVCYMPQNYEDQLDLSKSPLEWLSITGDKEETTQIRTYLGSMRYTPDEMFHPMSELSGGQKAKILFLKMILSGANVLLLDEPTRNFSPLSNPVIRQVLKDFGGSIISISHDRKYIEEVVDTVYELTQNGLVKK